MRCPFCNYEDSKVLDSRPAEEGRTIRRRRECQKCFRRFTTYEKVEEFPLIVVKKDGRREAFDSNKLLSGLVKACGKRPVSLHALEDMVRSIEKEAANSLEREIDSEKIGEMVMERLKTVDEVAYVRFASVYRQFKDIQTFLKEIQQMQQKDKK